MKNNEKNKKEELNYKKAYYYLFNKTTDMIKALKTIQRKAEEICTNETPPDDIEIDTEKILTDIINNINNVNNTNIGLEWRTHSISPLLKEGVVAEQREDNDDG